jgi:hypothetical protein
MTRVSPVSPRSRLYPPALRLSSARQVDHGRVGGPARCLGAREVADSDGIAGRKSLLQAFIKKLEANGIKLDRPYTKNEQTGAALAFITDPWGTYIELNDRPNPAYIN